MKPIKKLSKRNILDDFWIEYFDILRHEWDDFGYLHYPEDVYDFYDNDNSLDDDYDYPGPFDYSFIEGVEGF